MGSGTSAPATPGCRRKNSVTATIEKENAATLAVEVQPSAALRSPQARSYRAQQLQVPAQEDRVGGLAGCSTPAPRSGPKKASQRRRERSEGKCCASWTSPPACLPPSDQ